ncbi:MAG TPA: zf-HC2 domain-containing protein [Accumulibacter sp.]|jgi:hypothetical protein|nr:zf-HC2 domain-containing protein [Accumulibacter sp.]HQC80212.1 zf-HC2 domain-containing protein [Accumulibacter sp.]
MNCRDATRLMSSALDRRLTRGEGLGLRLHVLICKGCRHLQGQMAFLRQACRRERGDDGPAALPPAD